MAAAKGFERSAKADAQTVIMSVTSEDVMTLEEAAVFLRCHPKTIMRKADTLHIPYKRLGTLWRFSRVKLEAWMRDNEDRAA
jgi:excisionase family DNA binding protein